MIRAPLRKLVAFVLASLVLTWWIAGQIQGSTPSGAYRLRATFDDVNGLHAGDDVRMAGIPIGRVSSIKVRSGHADVQLAVDPKVHVPDDSEVLVRWRNLIGQRYLAIRPGKSSTDLRDGAAITRATDVVDLGRLVDELAPLARAVGPTQINQVLESLLAAFDGNDAAFDQLVANVGALTAALQQREGTLNQLIDDSAAVTSAISSRDQQIAAMATNLEAIASTIDDTDQLLSQGVTEVARFTTNAAGLLASADSDLGNVIELVASLTGTAVDNLDSIETALQTLPTMLDALLPEINRGPFLRVNLLCIAVGPGPCPEPLLFFKDQGAG